MASSSSLSSSSSNKATFDEDDEETLRLLLLLDQEKPSAKRLQGLASRFLKDVQDAESSSFYQSLCESARADGFELPSTTVQKSSNTNTSSDSSTPAAFDSDVGKKHIEAISSLLKVDKLSAVSFTMGALRSLAFSDESAQLQNLLGSRTLVLHTLGYSMEQSLARISCVTECLRLDADSETDPDLQQACATSVLTPIDQTLVTSKGHHRGLFQRLLTIACETCTPFTRDQLAPCQELQDTNATGVSTSSSASTSDRAWTTFVQKVFQEQRDHSLRQQEYALEALLMLLYQRLEGGVQRDDLILLLLAFSEAGSFFADNTQVPRLCHLAGLILVECMGLWRVVGEEAWALEHPLLLGLTSSAVAPQAEQELEGLRQIFVGLADGVQQRPPVMYNKNNLSVTQAPEALGIFSFGVLWTLAYQNFLESDSGHDTDAYWRTFATHGTELAQIANDQCGAFDYLHHVMDQLALNVTSFSNSANLPDEPFDWQLSPRSQEAMTLLENCAQDDNTGTGAYSSIARELLVASIVAFDNVLSMHHPDVCDNLAVLCNLVGAVYRNSITLCETFWAEWDIYASPSRQQSMTSPLCRLLDAAHSLANAAMTAFVENRVEAKEFIPAAAPFFKLLSSLCYNSAAAEETVKVLPREMIRLALLACRTDAHLPIDSSFRKSCVGVLESIGTLIHVGHSDSFHALMRSLLEPPQGSEGLVDGPRVLYRILTSTDDMDIIRPVLSAAAALLQGAPQLWSLQLARVFVGPDSSSGLARWLSLGNVCTPAAVQVLSGLVEHLMTVAFCKSFNEIDAVDFLQGVATGVLAASSTLASSLSPATTTLSGKLSLSCDTAAVILTLYGSFLRSTRSILELHTSEIVRLAALEIRDVLITALVNGSGLTQAIAYYATAPVSLSLTIQLQEFMDKSLFVPGDEDNENQEQNSKFGVWASVMKKPDRGLDLLGRSKAFLKETIASIENVDINLEGIQLRGWSHGGSLEGPLKSASAAIRLLSIWASVAEDIVMSTAGSATVDASDLNAEAKEKLIALSPRVLLTSIVPAPVPIRNSSSLSSTWAGVGPLNFELLLRYLEGSNRRTNIPTSATLDFLNACIVHDQAACTQRESALLRGVANSPRFASQLIAMATEAIDAAKKEETSQDYKMKSSVGLLSLRLLATACKSHPSLAASLLAHEEKSEWLATLSNCIGNVRTMLDSEERDYNEGIFCNSTSLLQIRLATGCLGILDSLWKVGRLPGASSPDFLTDMIESQMSTLKELLCISSKHAKAVDFEDIDEPSIEQSRGRCTLLTFMGNAMSVLSQELGYCACTNDTEKIRSMLISELGSDLFLLAPMARHYSSFDGFEMIFNDSLLLKEKADIEYVHFPYGLLHSSPSTSTRSLSNDFFVQENAFDINFAVGCLSTVLEDSYLAPLEIVENISSSYQTLICELNATKAWATFGELISNLFQQNGGPHSELFLTLSQEVLYALHSNLKPVEVAQVNISRGFLRAETEIMAARMSRSLLAFVDKGINVKSTGASPQRNSDLLLKILSKLTRTCSKVQDILQMNPSYSNDSEQNGIQTLCVVQQPLIGCAISLVRAIDSTSLSLRSKEMAYIELARATSKFVRSQKGLSRDGLRKGNFNRYISAPVDLLTVLIARHPGPSSQAVLDSYFSTMAETLKEHEIVENLLLQASVASSAAASFRSAASGKITPKTTSEKQELVIVRSVLAFVNALAETSHPSMLEILSQSRLAQILSGPLFVQASKTWNAEGIYRGYTNGNNVNGASNLTAPSGQSTSSLSGGTEDPVHNIWMLSMKILTSSLKSARLQKGTENVEKTRAYFVRMALDFLNSYHPELLMCIQDCFGAMNGSKSKPLTLTALREANFILGLVSELTSRENRNEFARIAGPLYEQFVRASLSITVSLSTFLGAIGASRELFIALTDLESPGSAGPISPGSNRPRNPLLANGIPYSKHEAIRYSHFARQSIACVTKSDYEDSTRIPSNFKHLSEGRAQDPPLERSCRQAVTSSFILQLEIAAAECLLHAINVSWDSHPAASSFVMFSYHEASRLDPMPLVKPGMVIAIRPGASEGVIVDTSNESMRFGKVVHCDTVQRAFHVNILSNVDSDNDGEDQTSIEVVSANRLAGIEDVTKRECISAYRPAPDSAADLEMTGSYLTLGHLILILRWCHQYSEATGESSGPKRDTVRRIAEQTAALLGAELSIHHEIGSPVNMPKADRSRLDWQILQLFGDSPRGQQEFTDQSSPIALHLGRMKVIMSDQAFNAIRPQVQREVKRARDELEQKEKRRREKRGLANDGPFHFGSIRRSGYKSPFRGLG